jgi:hypothetical protein
VGPLCCGRPTSPVGKLAGVLSTVGTLAFSTLFWVGVFDVVDDVVPAAVLNSTAVYAAMIATAFVLMWATGTLLEQSGAQAEAAPLSWRSPWHGHVLQALRSLVAIFAQVLLWYGMSSLYWVVCIRPDSDCSSYPATWWKDLFLITLGHLLMNATDTFLQGDEDEEQADGGPEAAEAAAPRACSWETVELYARATLAIFAAILHNVGIWNLFDKMVVAGWTECSAYPGPPYGHADGDSQGGLSTNELSCLTRNLLFIAAGFFVQPNNFLLPVLQPDRLAEASAWGDGAAPDPRRPSEANQPWASLSFRRPSSYSVWRSTIEIQ